MMLLAESTMQAVIGSMLGCIVGVFIVFIVPIKALSGFETNIEVVVSPVMIIILLGLSIFSGIIAGVFPARRISRQNPADILRRL